MAVTTRLISLTPEKAKKYFDNRSPNRSVSDHYARILAGAIVAGEWETNGETIKFDTSDKLIDGQHRCLGVVIAGKPIMTFATFGLNAATFDTIDTGRRRNVGDVLAKHGESNYTQLAGSLAWLWKHEAGYLKTGHQASPRHAEALQMLEKHGAIRESIPYGRAMRAYMSVSLATFLHYLFSRKSSSAADFFFCRLVDGEGLSKGSRETSAIHLLRNRLIDNRGSKTKLPPMEICKLVIKAWNAYRSRRVIKTLRHRTEGSAAESFPEVE